MDLFYVLLVLILVAIFTYWFFTRPFDYWLKQRVPCLPSPLPGFGHMLPIITLRENLTTLSLKAYKQTNASAIGFFFLQRPGLIVRDPELVKSVLLTNFNSFYNNGFHLDDKVDPILSRNPFFATDLTRWKTTRARTTSHLSGKKLRHLFVIFNNVCSKMEDFIDKKIEENSGVYECELKQHFTRYTGEIIANSFGIEGQNFRDKPDRLSFASVAKIILAPTLINGIKQALLFYMPSIGKLLKMNFLSKSVDNYFRENAKAIVKKRKQSSSEPPNDYLQFCVDANGEDNIVNIIADLITFFGDVYETTGTALSTLFYHLSQNKTIQDKLREHVKSVLDESEGTLTYEALKKLTYLEQAIFESMRLLPPLGAQLKECTKEITIEGSDGLKYHLEPGHLVVVPVNALHKDTEYWSNPEVFDPDRFSPENMVKRNKFVYLAFGEGPRMCIGMRLGMILVKMAAVSLITKYSIEDSQKTKKPLEYDPGSLMLYIKGGLWGRFEKLK